MEHEWQPMAISEVAARFDGSGIDWWIAGRQAIDLFLGWETRPHADLDVEMFRRDRSVLFDIFDGWDLHAMSEGNLVPWTDPKEFDNAVFGIWLRPARCEPWQVEIMLADGNRSEWRFRRDPCITIAGERLIATTPGGVPYCTPEVQLLYKSKMARPKDDVDLAHCLHHLSREQRCWLIDAIATTSTHHPWVGVLEASLHQQHE
jgi:hypothetical protein